MTVVKKYLSKNEWIGSGQAQEGGRDRDEGERGRERERERRDHCEEREREPGERAGRLTHWVSDRRGSGDKKHNIYIYKRK